MHTDQADHTKVAEQMQGLITAHLAGSTREGTSRPGLRQRDQTGSGENTEGEDGRGDDRQAAV